MRILVVEDEKRIADFLGRGLESAGYAVDLAGAGREALELVHSAEYDLIILDLMLPDLDGLQVLERVRNRKSSPPVLILSARGTLEDRVRGSSPAPTTTSSSRSPSSSCWRASGRC